MHDLFYNAGFGLYYLRLHGRYYQRRYGGEWQPIQEDQLLRPIWSPLQPKQRLIFTEQLRQQGLID